MAFKIYTYADPYKIHLTDFWNEIKYYPHLCASRTLVRGLMSVLPEEEIQTLFCPLDSIVNDRIYADWTKNISRRIQQYSELGNQYKKWHDHSGQNGSFGDARYEAFTHNKNAMLDSLRLFIELGISSNSLDTQNLNIEHRIFAYLLKLEENTDLFSLPSFPRKSEIIKQFIKQAEQERSEKERLHKKGGYPDTDSYQRDLHLIDRMIKKMSLWDGNNLVVHGIHQFSPLQLRFLSHLDKMGVEVIFLYNYLPAFKEIYSSWNYIYQQFDAPIHHDKNIASYNPTLQFPRTGTAIAENLAFLCEENISRNDPRMIRNYEHYKSETVLRFDNISEYAGYVSDLFSEAETRLKESPYAEKFPLQRPSTAAVLAYMDDVIYTANKDVDELLQVYHPKYARNRHFLAYPIGQFFLALYSLWNITASEIDIDYNLLRECVNSGILTGFNTEQLLKTLLNVEPLFAHIHTFSEFDELFNNYRHQYTQISGPNRVPTNSSLRMMNLYNNYKVTEKDLEDLHAAIREINSTAKDLFGIVSEDEQFLFGSHFQRLKDFVDKKQSALADEEEKDLISNLLVRLEVVQKQLDKEDRKGTLEDLRSGLYFFLKQKEDPVSDWFVRNFEQIDGDVLLSKKQNFPGREKVYHFACVSDKDMNRTVNELLPWPLSEMFIEKAYNPKELPFQVYYAALGERSNFLRYALFYGLYFSQCETKISFVKRYGNDSTNLYEMLRLIGLEDKDSASLKDKEEYHVSTIISGKKLSAIKYDQEQMAAMFLCPYRFMLDYVLNPHPTLAGTFLLQRFYVNSLIENTWIAIAGNDQDSAARLLEKIITQESAKIERFFPFFSSSEIIDMKRQAENYISAQVFKNGSKKVRPCDRTHMNLRKVFGRADFLEDLQDLPAKHPYSQFEKLAKIKDGKKSYSTHSIPKTEDKRLVESMINYINSSQGNGERPGSWCSFCPNNGLCLSYHKREQT